MDSSWSQDINTFEGHEDPVFKLVFSPDGRLLASISAEAIRLWDLTIGTLRNSFQANFEAGYDDHRELVVFSPNSRLLASVPYTGPMRLWNVVTGVPQDSSLTKLTNIQNVRFSPDSRMLASVSNRGTINLHGLETGTSERSLKSHSRDAAIRIFSYGLVLASGFKDGQIEIVNLLKGIKKNVIKGHSKLIDGLAFSPDGLLLASMSKGDGLIRLWNVTNGTPISEISSPLEPPSPRMLFSPDNGTFVFVTPTGIQLRDPKSGGLRLLLDADFADTSGETFKVREIAFSGTGSTLVFVGSGGRISLWDCAAGTRTRTYRRHAGLITSATLAPKNQGLLMASGSENGTVRLLDLTTTQAFDVDAVEIKEMIFSHDGRLLASRSPREVHIWDTLSGTNKNILPHDFDYDSKGRVRSKYKERGDIISMAFNHDSTLLAFTDGGEMEILLWSVSKGAPKKTILSVAGTGVLWADNGNFLAFSPSGLLASSYGRVVVLWDPITGARLHQWMLVEKLSRLEFTQNGLFLGTNDDDRVLIRDLRDSFSENSHRVNLHVAFSVLRIQGMLRSIGVERGLREISGLKKRKGGTATTRIRNFGEGKQGPLCIDGSEIEGPQLYIEGKQWIVLNGNRVLWLPLEFRPELGGQYKARVDERGSMLALGSMSGHVYFIGFDMNSCT